MTKLGIDYGERRIGLAITDALEMIASPLETLQNDKAFLQKLKEIIDDRNVDTVVVGMPLSMDGTRGPAAEKTERFVESLKAELEIEVATFDERLTTAQAQRWMISHDISRKKRAKRVDEMAAQMILQTYMDASKRKRIREADD